MFPNLWSNVITIRRETASQFQTISFSGAGVMQGNLFGTNTIDVSALENGMYFINLQNETANARASFVKQ